MNGSKIIKLRINIIYSTKLLLTAKSQDPQPLTDDVPPIQNDS